MKDRTLVHKVMTVGTLVPIALLALAVFALLWQRLNDGSQQPGNTQQAAVIATGFKKEARVRRVLSQTQIDRLEKHFLTTPPRVLPIEAPSGPLKTIGEVQSINNVNDAQVGNE